MEKNNISHIELGKHMDIFTKLPEVGQGLVLWKPHGAMLRYLLEKFSQEAHILNGYQWVYTPHIGKSNLWETSGHLDYYKDSMYNPIEIDGEEYYLKPMSCPFHVLIYKDGIKSYRDLPIRYAEYASVYRYELSGVLHGLTRVRGFTQDDAHIIAAPEQIEEEIFRALIFSLYILKKFNFTKYKAYIATRNSAKSIGSPADWEKAESQLKQAVIKAGLEYEIDEGGGAFYGPKIDLKLTDNSGREWQCSTIQFDFNLPERFQMFYIGQDGQKHTPMMVHRALFGSIERFTAMLLEHFNGEFPFWLSPVQARILTVSNEQKKFAESVYNRLKKEGYRIEFDTSDEPLGAKIRNAEISKIPVTIIIGTKEQQASSVTVRTRQDKKQQFLTLDALFRMLEQEQSIGKAEYIHTDL
ncbi:MAG: threonine--tRNA ligase [Clostridiaceae bacterium]|jgi:threonyl-tRNA synthetase|nr:threonine--tRNA ligase [Clostridiaceae bacterium]